YLYQDGQRLQADDDYAVYKVGNTLYVVNKSGKIQKSTGKKYELDGGEGYVTVNNNGTFKEYFEDDDKATKASTLPTSAIRTGGYETKTNEKTDGFWWEP
ncbi:MAG: hypothetical protein MR562_07405, partial [Clostridiaceae bacterium]|nr:hypothetical protein [Clostridiaceae bacterium]